MITDVTTYYLEMTDPKDMRPSLCAADGGRQGLAPHLYARSSQRLAELLRPWISGVP